MGNSLAGKRAFVTGSFQGIGLGIATTLASEGASLVLHGLADAETIAKAEAAVIAAGASKVESHVSDLRDVDATEALIAKILAGGAVDILVNNAGIQHTATIAEMPRSKWNDIIAINLSSFFDTMRLLLPEMAKRGSGRVVNIASVHGLVASAAKGPYVAAKHGVVGLTKVAALEYAAVGDRDSGGVTINAMAPALIESPMSASFSEAQMTLLKSRIPMGRLGKPEEVANLAAWIVSPECSFTTGFTFDLSGGRATY